MEKPKCYRAGSTEDLSEARKWKQEYEGKGYSVFIRWDRRGKKYGVYFCEEKLPKEVYLEKYEKVEGLLAKTLLKTHSYSACPISEIVLLEILSQPTGPVIITF